MSKVPKKLWRDAATVIVAAKNSNLFQCQQIPQQQNSHKHRTDDYSLLMLKRHSNSNFMANRYVFPGGVIDKADYCEQWIDIFGAHGHSQKKLLDLYKSLGSRPSMFEDYRYLKVIPDIAFRICAAREAFEECGLMIFTAGDQHVQGCLSHEEVLHWRKKVHNDAFAFLELCREYKMIPDIWSLTEWSNWLTPVQSERRFDTMFYMYASAHQPSIDFDEKEMSDALWRGPKDLLCDYIRGELQLPPPQIYELARLEQFSNLKELAEFSLQREALGVERHLPLRINLSNGVLSLAPGDYYYTDEPDKTFGKDGDNLNDLRLEDLQSKESFNRMEFRSLTDFKVICNQQRNGHKCINFSSQEFFKSRELSSNL